MTFHKLDKCGEVSSDFGWATELEKKCYSAAHAARELDFVQLLLLFPSSYTSVTSNIAN